MKNPIMNMFEHLQAKPIIGIASAMGAPVFAFMTSLTSDDTLHLVGALSLYLGALTGFVTLILQLSKLIDKFKTRRKNGEI